MKKLLLMTVALLSLGAALAYAADGMNLAWGSCRISTNNASAATNDFTMVQPCADPTNAFAIKRVVASFKNGTTLLNFGGTTIHIDIQVQPLTLPDYWDLSGAGCRAGSLVGPATSSNAGNCTTPYKIVPVDPSGESESEGISANIAAGTVSFEADHVRNTTPVSSLGPPVSLGGYLANNLAFDDNNNDPSSTQCAGCNATACLNLLFVKYFSLTESRTILATELRNWITVNGGNGGSCSGAVPTKNTTWGQVKALYR